MKPISSLVPSMLRPAAFALAAVLFSLQAFAVDPPKGWEPRTGDAWVDRQLEDVNRYGDRYREAFVDELVRYQSTPRELAEETLAQGWKPGDLYYACAMAQSIGQPCRNVVAEWNRDHEQGWLDVGKRLGIAPGSAQFGELKRGFAASYERWARPLTLDAESRKASPGRGKTDASAKGGRRTR
ncbi:hypothetical protein FCE95_15690 [Luteimonas gilva]|uniref:Uncharacterized protein n=1 Tax=Luteimonas gilva TaxID=2572684 RepID=A0A4U5JM13_9GAMM|nr:hypothetical protein [Luteimonas gilva]TKR29571.1 hypothetical protein FCE95_15690 [Luteimonas gilva]